MENALFTKLKNWFMLLEKHKNDILKIYCLNNKSLIKLEYDEIVKK